MSNWGSAAIAVVDQSTRAITHFLRHVCIKKEGIECTEKLSAPRGEPDRILGFTQAAFDSAGMLAFALTRAPF